MIERKGDRKKVEKLIRNVIKLTKKSLKTDYVNYLTLRNKEDKI
jgi:hypothetical protein